MTADALPFRARTEFQLLFGRQARSRCLRRHADKARARRGHLAALFHLKAGHAQMLPRLGAPEDVQRAAEGVDTDDRRVIHLQGRRHDQAPVLWPTVHSDRPGEHGSVRRTSDPSYAAIDVLCALGDRDDVLGARLARALRVKNKHHLLVTKTEEREKEPLHGLGVHPPPLIRCTLRRLNAPVRAHSRHVSNKSKAR